MRRLASLQERAASGRLAGSDRPTSFDREQMSAWINQLLGDPAKKIERELEKRGFQVPPHKDIADDLLDAMLEAAVSIVDQIPHHDEKVT